MLFIVWAPFHVWQFPRWKIANFHDPHKSKVAQISCQVLTRCMKWSVTCCHHACRWHISQQYNNNKKIRVLKKGTAREKRKKKYIKKRWNLLSTANRFIFFSFFPFLFCVLRSPIVNLMRIKERADGKIFSDDGKKKVWRAAERNHLTNIFNSTQK